MRDLVEALVAAFTVDEFRRFADHAGVARGLPVEPKSAEHFFHEVVALYERQGVLEDGRFWAALLKERPRGRFERFSARAVGPDFAPALQGFRDLRRVREGEASQLWEGVDARFGVTRALKVAHGSAGQGGARLRREAEVLLGRARPGVVRAFDLREAGDHLVLVLEHHPLDLARAMENGPMSPERVVQVGVALADTLATLHAGPAPVHHRDVKPENVLLDTAGVPLLCDFGHAALGGRVLGEQRLTRQIQGRYAAPEVSGVVEGDPEHADRADVYGLASVLLALTLGKDPEEAPFLMGPAKDLLGGALAGCFDKRAKARPRMAELRERLRGLVEGEVVELRRRVAVLTTERDEARKEAAERTKERDAARAEVAERTKERDAARAEVEKAQERGATTSQAGRALALGTKEVEARRGRWAQQIEVEGPEPAVFRHYFIVAHGDNDVARGAILKGESWYNNRVPYWQVVHGWCKAPRCRHHVSWVTCLGPTWDPSWKDISDAVHGEGGKRLERFIEAP